MPRILTLLLAFAVAAVTSAAAERAGKPNIIVIFTDDHGYADLGCQGVRVDVRTPHLDALAAGGVRMTSGYITAPQCVPSRAGLLTGRYQNEFGLESNTQFQAPGGMDGFMAALTIPERLKKAGYATGMAGKWHLGPGGEITKHGFDQVFYKNSNRPGTANFGLDGKDRPLGPEKSGLYHLDACSAAACAFVERHRAQPFFFYLDGKEPAPAPPRQQKDRRRKPRAAPDAKTSPPVAGPAGRPNVIFILADDLGWADTTLYGHTKLYETPNLARLAARGMTFTRAYANSPLCSPTRASILTGQTTARHGSTAPAHHTAAVRLAPALAKSAPPGSKALMPLTVTRLVTTLPTLGKLVRGAGYRTAHFGKWHLGPEPYSPLEHGFEIDLPHHPGPGPAGSFVAPWKFRNFTANKPKEHIEDRMASEAAKWIRSVKDEPFFMNYWQFSVHAPFDAKEELIAQYRDKVNPKSPQRSPTYAAMVHSLDDAVGTLLDAVEAAGIAERTAFVFLSDNGGNMYNEVDGTTPTSNRPLRGGKATIYEGGIRVPCVVAWPGVTKPGTRSDEIVQSSDFYPTLLKLLGIPFPANHQIDGIDLTPALRGGKLAREGIFTYFPHAPPVPDWLPPSVSVHRGDWKLIRLFLQGEKGAHRHHLYNLRDDLGEANNLAGAKPELVAELDRFIESHLNEAGTVVPVPNPQFDPAKYRPELEGVGNLRGQPKRKR